MEFKPAVLTLTTDPATREKAHSIVLGCGGRSIVASNSSDFFRAIDGYYPALLLIDLAFQQDKAAQKPLNFILDESKPGGLQEASSWVELIERCKLLPRTRSITLVAFGQSKVDLSRAKGAGADFAFLLEQFWSELATIADKQIHPPIQYLDGWDDALPADARRGLEEFNRGEYFEQHELLEAAWLAESRPIRDLYQGILQVGVALLQIERNNWAGAVKLFRRGLPKLRALPSTCQGIQLADLRAESEGIHYEISMLGPKKLCYFDQARFPKIKFD